MHCLEVIIKRNNASRYVDARSGGRGKLFDRDGKEIEEHVVWADLQSGHCICYWQVDGAFVQAHDGGLKQFSQFFPAPLKFVPAK
jgi:hypothetical protein